MLCTGLSLISLLVSDYISLENIGLYCSSKQLKEGIYYSLFINKEVFRLMHTKGGRWHLWLQESKNHGDPYFSNLHPGWIEDI